MSEKINIKTKGDTDVIFSEGFNSRAAEVRRPGKADWDDFEVIGGSNEEERKHVASAESDPKRMKEALKLIRKSHLLIGRNTLGALNRVA